MKYIITLFVNVCLCSHDVAGWESKFKRSEVSCSVGTRAHKTSIQGKLVLSHKQKHKERAKMQPLLPSEVIHCTTDVTSGQCSKVYSGMQGSLGFISPQNYHK